MKRTASSGTAGSKRAKGAPTEASAAAEELEEETAIYAKYFFKKCAVDLLGRGLRHDGRQLAQARDLAVRTGVLPTAYGSAMVTQGASRVICGVQGVFAPPLSDAPGAGRIEVRCSIAVTADHTVSDNPGFHQQQGNSIAFFVSSMVKASNMVDLTKLCVRPGSCAWVLRAELYVLNHDGSLRDCCLAAVTAALLSTRLPVVDVADAEPVEVKGKQRLTLGITSYPLCTTMGWFKDRLLVDLTASEEKLGSSITVVHDSAGKLINVYKSGGPPVPDNAVKAALEAGKAECKKKKAVVESTIHKKKAGGLF
ncbi:Exosome complex component Rrp42 [Diplonema papillatum]|nr:Exosome complex component Rrp42 [Diplonema papillatum]KAJ9471965.1 Exosome complex component Rrp42 [Diplonema papillatum]